MAFVVVTGAMLQCPMGTGPGTFNATPGTVMAGTGVGVVGDVSPANIPTAAFIMCNSPKNPAGMGKPPPAVPTPCPCTFIPIGMWQPGATKVTMNGQPVLLDSATISCALGTAPITIASAGQQKVQAS